MFCHSPESWIDLWDREVMQKGAVEVKAKLVMNADKYVPSTVVDDKIFEAEEGRRRGLMVWSVKRL